MTDYRQRMMKGVFTSATILFIFLFLLLGNLLESYFENERADHYREKLNLITTQIGSSEVFSQSNEEILTSAEDIMDGDVILYDQGGRQTGGETTNNEEQTLSDSTINRLEEDNFFYMETETSTRYITPIYNEENQIVSFLELSRASQLDNTSERIIWTILFFSLTIVLIILLYFFSKITKTILNPISDATKAAKELAKGNFKARTYEFQLENPGNLNHSINILARNLERMTSSYELEQERLETLIENMGSSLILIDVKGYIGHLNRAFKETFGIDENDWSNFLYYDVLPYPEVTNMVEEILLTEESAHRQLLIPIGIERRHFDVIGAPIASNEAAPKGIVVVFHDITELKNLEQMRKDFVANVSHELRTPVTSVKGFAETLLDGALDNKEISERFLNIIWKESDRLQHIIQDLLDLSKVEQHGFELNWQTVDLAEVLEDVMLLLKSKADEKEINFISEVKGDCSIAGDSVRIRQIFINIISNSLAYTDKGGEVSILLAEKEDSIQFVVKDNGRGMAKEEIPRIFERFYRIDKARSRNSGGTGLGLAIVKHLVEAHGGHIQVESESQVGTEFMVEFNKERNGYSSY